MYVEFAVNLLPHVLLVQVPLCMYIFHCCVSISCRLLALTYSSAVESDNQQRTESP